MTRSCIFSSQLGNLGELKVQFAICKLLSLITCQYFTFKYFFKIFMKISLILEACCFKINKRDQYMKLTTQFNLWHLIWLWGMLYSWCEDVLGFMCRLCLWLTYIHVIYIPIQILICNNNINRNINFNVFSYYEILLNLKISCRHLILQILEYNLRLLEGGGGGLLARRQDISMKAIILLD
jgi:hypothetical protein